MLVLNYTSCHKKKQREDFDEDKRARYRPRRNDARGRLVCCDVEMAQPSLGENLGANASDGLKYKPITVKTPDGLTISAQEWGNPAGPEILFIHGFSQGHLSWIKQMRSE